MVNGEECCRMTFACGPDYQTVNPMHIGGLNFLCVDGYMSSPYIELALHLHMQLPAAHIHLGVLQFPPTALINKLITCDFSLLSSGSSTQARK